MSHVLTQLERRRLELGMPYPALSKRAGVPLPTLTRSLNGSSNPSFATIEAIAEALGMPLLGQAIDSESLLEQQAQSKAKRLVDMTQATSALENQAVSEQHLERMRKQNYHALLSGSRRRLWSE